MTGFLRDFWAFLSIRKRYWLAPVLLVFLLFGGLVALTKDSTVAPFLYALF